MSGSGTGIGFANVSNIAANNTGASRTAALTLNGNAYLRVTRPDISCNYTVDQSVYPISAAGGWITAVMTTGAGCAWQVTNYYPAGVSTASPTGTGSATISFTVAPNGGTIERDFYLPVGPQFNDTQVHISPGYDPDHHLWSVEQRDVWNAAVYDRRDRQFRIDRNV